jgi:hypothetical protein
MQNDPQIGARFALEDGAKRRHYGLMVFSELLPHSWPVDNTTYTLNVETDPNATSLKSLKNSDVSGNGEPRQPPTGQSQIG